MKLKVYGCRGSVPTSRYPASQYGGNTSCMALETQDRTVILDAGSGLAQLDRAMEASGHMSASHLNILISHLHLDHIIGLTVFGPVWDSNKGVKIFTCLRGEGTLKGQIFGAFAPPYWPTSMSESANAECIAIEDNIPFNLGDITITPFTATHPDDTLSFQLKSGDKTVVHLLDSETSMLNDQEYAKLVEYCRGADLVIFDAAYSPTDYPKKRGYGHSTIEDGFKLAALSNCKRMMFSHFSFEYSDEDLDALETQAKSYGDKFLFARDGMELDL